MDLNLNLRDKCCEKPYKFMSEITRKGLQVIAARGITSKSDTEDINAAEHELAEVGFYKDYASAQGRIRRDLLTYFKAYGCLDENEQLTEIGRLFAENKITVQEFCFHYVMNCKCSDGKCEYYPLYLIFVCLRKLEERHSANKHLTDYDLAQLAECRSVEQIDVSFIDKLLAARHGDPVETDARSAGYDVWSYMLVTSGILYKLENKRFIVLDRDLEDWIMSVYEKPLTIEKGKVLTGAFNYLPIPPLKNSPGNPGPYMHETKALQAFLFERIGTRVIKKYIFSETPDKSFSDMTEALGLTDKEIGFYARFRELERLIGFCLAQNSQKNIRVIGNILSSSEIKET